MSALGQLNIFLNTYCDYTKDIVYSLGPEGEAPQLVYLYGYTAALMVKQTPSGPALIPISTTPNSQGSLSFDDAPLSGTVTVANGSENITFTDAQTLDPGATVQIGNQLGVYYTIPAGVNASTSATLNAPFTGGSASGVTTDLVTGTITITITRAATPALVGIDQARFDLVLTSPAGLVDPVLISGQCFAYQTITH